MNKPLEKYFRHTPQTDITDITAKSRALPSLMSVMAVTAVPPASPEDQYCQRPTNLFLLSRHYIPGAGARRVGIHTDSGRM
jgi:hypothetical protein